MLCLSMKVCESLEDITMKIGEKSRRERTEGSVLMETYTGYGLPHAVMRLDYSGNCLTRTFASLFSLISSYSFLFM